MIHWGELCISLPRFVNGAVLLACSFTAFRCIFFDLLGKPWCTSGIGNDVRFFGTADDVGLLVSHCLSIPQRYTKSKKIRRNTE